MMADADQKQPFIWYTAEIVPEQFLFLRSLKKLCVLKSNFILRQYFTFVGFSFSTNVNYCLLKTNIFSNIFVKLVID